MNNGSFRRRFLPNPGGESFRRRFSPNPGFGRGFSPPLQWKKEAANPATDSDQTQAAKVQAMEIGSDVQAMAPVLAADPWHNNEWVGRLPAASQWQHDTSWSGLTGLRVAPTRHFWRRTGVRRASDTDTGTTRRTPVSKRCLFFFASPTRHRHGGHASSEKKRQKITDQTSLCPSPVLDRADRRVGELHRQSPSTPPCPLSLPISLSLSLSVWTGIMACYVCHYKKLNCTEGCPFARFFDEGNISTYDKISRFQPYHVLEEWLRPCSMEEDQRVIGQCLVEAEARIPNLDLCNPCRFLEANDCKGEQCDLRQYFDTESGLAKLEAIVKLKTKKFFVSNFRKAGGKKAARVDTWYEEAVRVSTVEVLAYDDDKATFNRVKEAMGADWVKNEFHIYFNFSQSSSSLSSSSSFLLMATILCLAKMLARLLLLPAGAGSRRNVLAAIASLLASTSSVTTSGSTSSVTASRSTSSSAGAGSWRSALAATASLLASTSSLATASGLTSSESASFLTSSPSATTSCLTSSSNSSSAPSFSTPTNSLVGGAAARAASATLVVGVENEGAEEELEEVVRHEAVAEGEVVRKEADFDVAEPEAVTEEEVEASNEAVVASALLQLPAPAEEEVEPEAVTEEVEPGAVIEEVEASKEAVAASTLLPLPAPAGRSRRRASILAELRIVAIDKKEDEEDNEDED
ncbi:hypothetical protein SO802_015950 [Lithocarpus litseifolius]|uniref:LOB domain-containing protein n=1 Tax=Lithocarpus litseifolius TaxID=425828 RepID=A0AAW2CXJ3_9ROSI